MPAKTLKKKPYRKGFLSVGFGHKLYFELFGNPKGVPVVFLHGGPGGGFQKKDYEFFDSKKFNVLFFDQRGSGKSKSRDVLKNNTTKHLVKDIVRLMNFVGFKRAILFGGSWGSTLALVFAIQHSNRVVGLVLRGVYLADWFGREHLYFGGVQSFFPEEWERFISMVPKRNRKNPEKYYFQQIHGKDKKNAKKFMRSWVCLELSMLKLVNNEKETTKKLNEKWVNGFAKVSSHYLSNNCFLSYNYILKNIQKIARLPVSIVHGRYDMVCPPLSAYRLHNKLLHSRLCFTAAGHTGREKETLQKLKQELFWISKQVQKKHVIQAMYCN